MLNNSIIEPPIFPKELFNEVLRESRSNIVAMSCVSIQFNAYVKDFIEKTPLGSLGLKEWKSFNGDPGDVFPIPVKLYQNFDPVNEILQFIPEKLNGEYLSLSSIDRFVSDFKNGKDNFKSNYRFDPEKCGVTDGTALKFKSRWVIQSKGIVDGTKYRKIGCQESSILSKKLETPKLINKVVGILMHELQTGEFLFPFLQNKSETTYTHVLETGRHGRIAVGGHSPEGLVIDSYFFCGEPNNWIGMSYERTSKST